MGRSRIDVATRALVSLLVVLARSYLVVLEVKRESPPEEILKAYSTAGSVRDCSISGGMERHRQRQGL